MAQTPRTWDDYVGDGVEDTYQVTFPYQKAQEVFVTVDGEPVEFTFISEGWVQLAAAPASGAAIRIQRSTAAFELRHEFANGVPLLPRYIDENNNQLLYVTQEAVNETAGTAAAALEEAKEARRIAQDAEDKVDGAIFDSAYQLRLDISGPAGQFGATAAVANVAELRAYQGKYDGERVRLLQYGTVAGLGEGVFRRVTTTSLSDNGVTVFGAPGNVRWVREESAGPIDVRWAGAVPAQSYSAAMPDSKDAVARAQAAAGADGIVHFPLPAGWAEAHYLLDSTGLNLAGSYISADPGVVVHAPYTSDSEGEKPRLIGDVVFSEQAPSGTWVYKSLRGQNKHPALAGISAGMAAGAVTLGDRQVSFPFTEVSRGIIITDFTTSAATLDAAGMTIAANSVSWSNAGAAGANYQGVEFAAAAGAEVECLVHNNSNSGASGELRFGVRCYGPHGATASAAFYRFTIAGSAFQLYRGTTLLLTWTPEHPADLIASNQGAVRVGIRIGAGGRYVQLVLNGKLYGELGLGTATAASIFFVADQAARATCRFMYPTAKCRDFVPFARTLKVAALGDSITRGARSSNEWPQLLKHFAGHLPGIGEITTMTNMGVSGITANTVASQIATYDFSPYDYVLVLLGTNDCQVNGQPGAGPYYNNLETIGNAIVAAGARPIFGIPPRYTSPSITGGGGATPSNLQAIPYYQHMARACAIANNWTIAEVDDFFGDNYGFSGSFVDQLSTSWYHDNVHPNSKGQIAVAAAFASALGRQIMKPVKGCLVAMIKPQGTFAIHNEASFGILRAVLQGGVVNVHGAVSGGAPGQVIGALPEWAIPAHRSVQAIFARTGGSQVPASVEIRNDGNLVSGIAWGTEQAQLSLSYHV